MISDVCSGINPYFMKDYRRTIIMTDDQIEQEIQAKGLTAPRITPTDIEGSILGEFYFTAGQGAFAAWKDGDKGPREAYYPKSLDLLTFCVLVLENGFTVTGESACVSPENFDSELGKKIARQNAIDKVWPLMGYALREKLYKNLIEQPKSTFVGPM